jgi:hypothetical protein
MEEFSEEEWKQVEETLLLSLGVMQAMQAYLYTKGLDVRPAMAAAKRVLDHLDGETREPEALVEDLKLVTELEERLQKTPGYPPTWTDLERERWKLMGDAWSVDTTVRQWDVWVENLARPRLKQTLPELEQRLIKMAVDLTPEEFAGEEWMLPLRVELTEFMRRVYFQQVVVALYWEQASQHEWQELSEVARDNVLDLLKHVDKEYRQELMGEMPIADRRRLEAMEQWTTEEWAKADLIEP